MRPGREALMVTCAFAVLAACGGDGDDGGTSANGPGKVLVSSSPMPPDATCPAGGTRIAYGSDANGNGQLEEGEIAGTQAICSTDPAPVLTSTSPSAPSAKCPHGGVIVTSGPDANGNGKLDPDEVRETNEVCAAGGGGATITKTSPIADGDPSCPFGGVRSESGADDGAGGGTANDGVLQPGEVTASAASCYSSASYADEMAPPPGATGTAKIATSGGAGSAGAGGNGGPIRIGVFGEGTRGGHVKLFRTGSYVLKPPPPAPAVDFGPVKLDVTANLTFRVATADTAINGEYYFEGVRIYFRKNDAERHIEVTGVHVAKNVTLTVPPGVDIVLANDFHNEGIVTAGLRPNGDGGGMHILPKRFVGAPGSKLTTAGGMRADGSGGWGDTLSIYADEIHIAGTLDASGGDAAPGGHAGGNGAVISLYENVDSALGITLLGNATSRGGKGTGNAAGGRAGFVVLQTYRFIVQRGTLDVSGGDGASGGYAGLVNLQATGGGVDAAGTILQRGGSALAAGCGAGECLGRSGGQLEIFGAAGDASFTGSWIGTGGQSVGTAGGGGGSVRIRTGDSSRGAAGNVRVSASLDARGGAGPTGGNGGTVTVEVATKVPNGQHVELRGYDGFDLTGGSGTTGGGDGGPIDWANGATDSTNESGSVLAHVPVIARGGNATASGAGGSGGALRVSAGPAVAPPRSSQAFVAAATIDVSGGTGITGGGASGAIVASARERIDVHAAITAKGGDGKGATATGGACGGFTFSSAKVTAKTPLVCGGGSGNGAAGGNGGSVTITSSQPPSSTAGVSAPGGAGTPPGTAGAIVVDGAPL